jgi:iron complex transport system ATP-binding protein
MASDMGDAKCQPGAQRDLPALALENVSVRHARAPRPSLARATLCVRAGEVVLLVGANGAGKSTLLRLGAGLLEPTEGAVRLGGVDARELTRRAAARSVAFVAQAEAVPEGFSVREVVTMGRAPHQGPWMGETAEDRCAIDVAIERMDLVGHERRPIETLSGGEQRRVAVARALAQTSRLLLLDEPAASLDLRHRVELHEALAAIAARDRIACVAATHDFDVAAPYASRVVLLDSGRIVADGPPDEVLTRENVRAVFGIDPGGGARWRVTREAG